MDAFKNWSRPVQITVGIIVGLLVIGVLVNLFGTAEDEPEANDTQTTETTTEVEETQGPAPATTEGKEEVAEEDITDWVKELRTDKAELIESATRNDSGEIRVHTNIVDPRVQGNSPEGTDALAICIAIADQDEDRVWIYEADGTTFVYMRDGICTEA